MTSSYSKYWLSVHFIPVILGFFFQKKATVQVLTALTLEILQFYKYTVEFKVSIPEFLSRDNTKARDTAQLSAEDSI